MNPGDVVLTPGPPDCWTESLKYRELLALFFRMYPTDSKAVKQPYVWPWKMEKVHFSTYPQDGTGYTYSESTEGSHCSSLSILFHSVLQSVVTKIHGPIIADLVLVSEKKRAQLSAFEGDHTDSQQ